MAEYLDFFNVYVMGVIEMAFQLYFLGKILKKKISLPLAEILTALPYSDNLPAQPISAHYWFLRWQKVCLNGLF